MGHLLLLSILTLSLKLITVKSLEFPPIESKYNKIIECLLSKGITENQIVLRNKNSSSRYKYLNYQWQLLIPVRYPFGYILPKTEDDIADAVTCGKKYNVRIVAKGGGHSFPKYSSGNFYSFVLDTRYMASIEIDNKQMVVTVGPGCLFGQITYKLWNNGKYFIPDGVSPTVGVAGFSLGGGYGYFSRRYGMTTDLITEMNVVVANGSLLTTNKNTNKDLFFALRGAGASFGIVTKFIFRLTPAPVVFRGLLEYKLKKFPRIFPIWQDFANSVPNSVYVNMDIFCNKILITVIDSTGTSDLFDTIANKLPRPDVKSTNVTNYADFKLYTATASFGSLAPDTNITSFEEMNTRKTYAPSYQIYKSFYADKYIEGIEVCIFYAIIKQHPAHARVGFRPYDGVISKVDKKSTAFVHRGKKYMVYAIYENSEPNYIENRESDLWLNEWYEIGKILYRHNESYQNYLDRELPDYLQRYYGVNLNRLMRLKAKYDPDNYFYDSQSIPPFNKIIVNGIKP